MFLRNGSKFSKNVEENRTVRDSLGSGRIIICILEDETPFYKYIIGKYIYMFMFIYVERCIFLIHLYSEKVAFWHTLSGSIRLLLFHYSNLKDFSDRDIFVLFVPAVSINFQCHFNFLFFFLLWKNYGAARNDQNKTLLM